MEVAAIYDPLGVNPAGLDHDSRLSLLESIEHQRSALDAQQQQTLALLAAEGDAEWRAREWVREEVAAVLAIAPVTAAAKLAEAKVLVHRLPLTFERLADGSMRMGHARAVIDAAAGLDDAGVVELEHRVADKAQQQTIGVFRQTVKRALLAIDPRRSEDKHRDALGQRRVRLFAGEDGMATIWAYLRADAAAGLWTTIDAAAHALPADHADRSGVERSMDQKRADVLAELGTLALNNTASTWQGQRPAVQVSVALSTLLDLDEQPGELDGYGPIPASMARDIAHDPSGTWRRLLTDHGGRLLHYGRSTYQPPPPSAITSPPNTKPAPSPAAAAAPAAARSTTSSPGPTADPPTRRTCTHPANATTTPNTKPAGPSPRTPTTPSPGPAPPAAATTPNPHPIDTTTDTDTDSDPPPF